MWRKSKWLKQSEPVVPRLVKEVVGHQSCVGLESYDKSSQFCFKDETQPLESLSSGVT